MYSVYCLENIEHNVTDNSTFSLKINLSGRGSIFGIKIKVILKSSSFGYFRKKFYSSGIFAGLAAYHIKIYNGLLAFSR